MGVNLSRTASANQSPLNLLSQVYLRTITPSFLHDYGQPGR